MGPQAICWTLAVAAWVSLMGTPPGARAAPVAWLTGAALQERLAQPVDNVYWSGTPLRRALNRLSAAERIAVVLDRRVDPDQKVEFSLGNVPLKEALEQIAEKLQLGLSLPGPLAYFGPPEAASRLWTLAELRRDEARKLPADVGRKFLQAERLAWEDFATPRDLLAQLAAQAGIEIAGLEQVPHDLWAAADLPPLPLVDRLTLIVVQFDLTFQIAADGRSIALVPAPENATIVRSYPGGRQPDELAARWAELVPDSRIKVVGEKIYVKGPMEDHQRLTDSQHTARRPSKPAGKGQEEQRHTLRVTNAPLGKVLEELAGRFQLELKIDEAALQQAGISLQQQVSFSVKDATMDGLFEAVLNPVGCTFRRQGKTLEVRPAD